MPSCVSLECLELWRDRGHSEMLSQGRVEKAFDGGLIFFLFVFVYLRGLGGCHFFSDGEDSVID